MRFLRAGLDVVFLLTSGSSFLGFSFAKKLHKSNGPSKRIADLSVFMAYSFGIYLAACLLLAFFDISSGEDIMGALLLFLFCLPFILAFLAKSYQQAETVFNLQMLGLILGILSMACLDQRVKHVLRLFG